jgi:hypothetical protein
LDGALKKRDYARLWGFFGEGVVVLAARGRTAGVVPVLFAIDPLEQDIKQEVTSKNANRQKYGNRHGGLTRADVNGKPEQEKSRSEKAKKS